MQSYFSKIKTKEHIRPILVTFLAVTAFFQFAIAIAGSHGTFSLKNKEMATIFYSCIFFSLTIIINLLALSKKTHNIIMILSFILNFISGTILVYYLFYMTKFNLKGAEFPILFFIIILIQVLMIVKIISFDWKYLFKHWI